MPRGCARRCARWQRRNEPGEFAAQKGTGAAPVRIGSDVKLVLTRLPERVGPEVDRACRSLGLEGSPVFVPIEPAPDALANRCIHNVRRAAERGEGDVVVGWKILVWPRILVQFIGHAVLESGERLVCITPDTHGDEQILFVADPSLTFDASDPMARMPLSRPLSIRTQMLPRSSPCRISSGLSRRRFHLCPARFCSQARMPSRSNDWSVHRSA